ncbi:MAG: ribonuclease P protein component [Thermodesulfobacteriota bacterium]
MPKTSLLRKPGEFERVYKQGKRLRGRGFALITLPNGLGFNRIGISIHRRIKGAVRRNRLKRIIRESFRLNRGCFPAGSDIVFTVRSDFTLTSPAEIDRAVSLLH